MRLDASPVLDGWAAALSRLPCDLDLDAGAGETRALRRGRGVADASVQLAPGRGAAGDTLRVIAVRKQTTPPPNSLMAAGFVLLATSLPEAIPAGRILATYRLRWQIESWLMRV